MVPGEGVSTPPTGVGSGNFNKKALRPGGFLLISSPGRQEHKVKDESGKSLSV